MKFAELGLSQPLVRALVDEGYSTPTPIQAQAIPQVLAGRDLLGCAQTGTGKTAAFALPILHRLAAAASVSRNPQQRLRVLVLSPTRELAAQIGESFRVYGRHTAIRQTTIFGGVNQQPQVRAIRQGVDVLVATPGRLVDLLNQGCVDLRAIETFVLDEADRMLDMGFLPDLKRIIARLPTRRQTLFFSATMPTAIDALAKTILRNPAQVRIAPVQATTDLIEQSVQFVSKSDKPRALIHYLESQAFSRVIVFTRTKHGADRVAKYLNHAGLPASALHGNKTQAQRLKTMAAFKSERPPVLVATDLAARGLDVDAVSHVVNYDVPNEPETYVHRIGRTGRAGATGMSLSLCDAAERSYLKAIERLVRQSLRVEALPDLKALAPASASRTIRTDSNTAVSTPRANGQSTAKPTQPRSWPSQQGGRRRRRKPQRSYALSR